MFGNGPGCSAGIPKCRYSALYENICPIPARNPQDRLQPFRGELADYMQVDRGVPTSHASMLACLPHQGPRWYFSSLLRSSCATVRQFSKSTYCVPCKRLPMHHTIIAEHPSFDEPNRLWHIASPNRGEKAAKASRPSAS